MGKRILLLLATISTICTAQISVPQTKKSFYGIVEATWCGLCGQYGRPATEEIVDQVSPNAVFISLHKSNTSALFSQTASDLATAFGVSGQPIFTLNGNNLGPYTSTIVSEVVAEATNFFSPSDADVNAGFAFGVVGDSLYVQTKTTFFQTLSGEYYMGIYVLEDSIWEWQVNYDPGIADMNVWHNRVLRTSLNGHFGQLIASGTTPAGTDVFVNRKIALDPAWNPARLKVFTLIWKKNGSVFEFVNANDIGSTLTGFVDTKPESALKCVVYPNPSNDVIYISGIPFSSTTHLWVSDLQGRMLLENTGSTEVDIRLLPIGTYLLTVVNEGTRYTQLIVKN